MMKVNIEKLRSRSVLVTNYIQEPGIGYEKFSQRKKEYTVDQSIIQKLRPFTNKVIIFVFSAEWCPDCHRNVPILELISEKTGIEIRVFGHIKRSNVNSTKKWSIPPSPEEAEEFNVQKIPYIILFDREGEKIGEIIENPPKGKTLEETLLKILTSI
ncbi:thioredoxin family protein [Candidatus Bathyarchaeota archaeon]|nr:thioredoxin family protein [Candidatus Bathyarchaeota archaeon]